MLAPRAAQATRRGCGPAGTLALVKAPEPDAGYEAVDPSKKSEWLLIDPDHRDRFGHAGDTVIPGAGACYGAVIRPLGGG